MELVLFILICVALFFVGRFLNKFKLPKTGSLVMVTGGVKAGKSTLSVHLAIKEYKRNLRAWRISKFFCRLFNKPIEEKPLLYSNVPLNCEYVPLTQDLILRKKRFRYRSVVYVQEGSLLADCMLVKNEELNNNTLLLFKLCAHETKGGKFIIDTQQIMDVHYNLKRSISEYFYVHHTIKWIPFFLVAYVRECRWSEDGTSTNVFESDIEDSLKRVIIPKSVWRKFDCYCYSVLTDDLKVEESIVDGTELETLKAEEIITFRKDLIAFNERFKEKKEIANDKKEN